MTKEQMTNLVLSALDVAAPGIDLPGYDYIEFQPGESDSIFIRAKPAQAPGEMFEVTVRKVP